MSWIPTLAPWEWALLAAVPIGIVLLYFLKLRREPVEVPSTYLWSRTIEDLHVNSLLQRLRRSLLLFLQLLAVALAAIALFRPGVRGETSGQRPNRVPAGHFGQHAGDRFGRWRNPLRESSPFDR